METTLVVPQGSYTLHRYPHNKNDSLRAWDAADEYLLQHLAQIPTVSSNSATLILNDNFGALTIALHHLSPITLSDSWISQQATQHNLVNNHLNEQDVLFKNSLEWPQQTFELVLIKVPKTLALLEDQLIKLQALLVSNTTVIAAGMVKAMSSSVWKLMEKYLGSTKPSLSKKKARLIFINLNAKLAALSNPYPIYYSLENTNYSLCNHANVFSKDSLDIGTRFLLGHLPTINEAQHIVDLGCGNGVVGLLLAQLHPTAQIHFVDESYMAIASAKKNFQQAANNQQAEFHIGDGLIEFTTNSMDLIICNPPFHQQNTIGNHIALSMFNHAYRVLKDKGELWVIGNRHLGYHNDLKRIFGKVNTIASNKKFVIYQVKK